MRPAGRVAELGSLGGSARISILMSKDALVFDSVSFWDLATERHLTIPGSRSIQDIAFVPLPGDRVRIEDEEQEFIVMYREFKFRSGICSVMVSVQPATRDT